MEKVEEILSISEVTERWLPGNANAVARIWAQT